MPRDLVVQSGFSLIELLVTIAIVGVLASIAIPQFASYQQDAMKARALTELTNIRTAIITLENDTGIGPGGHSALDCETPGGPELDLTDCSAGLLCNDGTFTNWAGPYVDFNLQDPWGRNYHIDYDYHCHDNPTVCDASKREVRAVVSLGEGGAVNSYHESESVSIICDYPG